MRDVVGFALSGGVLFGCWWLTFHPQPRIIKVLMMVFDLFALVFVILHSGKPPKNQIDIEMPLSNSQVEAHLAAAIMNFVVYAFSGVVSCCILWLLGYPPPDKLRVRILVVMATIFTITVFYLVYSIFNCRRMRNINPTSSPDTSANHSCKNRTDHQTDKVIDLIV
ncbi:hypothetical protein PIB30_009172 [Stylosanthes scabra]|uniref:Uncharacterized protein n=1 Tax=Stylosanthes scabra TaxID=79078 RepID=A0ABU6Y6T6_9FABA|nr:hypothetical protein [Stylosanthes scabra]